MKTDILIFIVAMIDIVAFVSFGFNYLFKAGVKFYDKAKHIEEMIRNGHDKDDVFNEIKILSGMSFHRTTSQRVHELCLMFEAKYGIDIIKK